MGPIPISGSCLLYTSHVTPKAAEGLEQTNVEFDVKFTVLDDQILEMLFLNIDEPTDEEDVYKRQICRASGTTATTPDGTLTTTSM